MEKACIDKIKSIVEKCGKENASYFNLISENGFMSFVDNDSTKAVFTDDLVYFVRTGENTIRTRKVGEKITNFPMTVTAMEYDTFKQAKVQVTFEGLNIFLKELGLAEDKEWKEFVTKCRKLGNTEAIGFNIGTDGKQIDLDGKDVSMSIPYLKPGLE